jgi:hypothetical protein
MMQVIDQLKRGKYRDASISIGKARLWPQQLGVGKPYDSDIDSRPDNYVEGLINEKSKGKAFCRKKLEIGLSQLIAGTGPHTF